MSTIVWDDNKLYIPNILESKSTLCKLNVTEKPIITKHKETTITRGSTTYNVLYSTVFGAGAMNIVGGVLSKSHGDILEYLNDNLNSYKGVKCTVVLITDEDTVKEPLMLVNTNGRWRRSLLNKQTGINLLNTEHTVGMFKIMYPSINVIDMYTLINSFKLGQYRISSVSELSTMGLKITVIPEVTECMKNRLREDILK